MCYLVSSFLWIHALHTYTHTHTNTVCVLHKLELCQAVTGTEQPVSWIKHHRAPQICLIHFEAKRRVDDSNLSKRYWTPKLRVPVWMLMPLQSPFNQSTSQLHAHVAALRGLSLCWGFSHWAIAKSQRGRSVLSWIKHDYWIITCGERSREVGSLFLSLSLARPL